MPQFGIFRGFSESSFGNKLFAGQTTADVGSSTQTFVFTVKTDNVGVSTSTQFRLPLTTSTGLDFVIDWGDGNTSVITSATDPDLTHTYSAHGTYEIKITGRFDGLSFESITTSRTKLTKVKSWGVNKFKVISFNSCNNCDVTATDTPDISLVTSLAGCFQSCTNLTNASGSIGDWNTSSVTDMSSMFYLATSFNKPLNFDTANVTTMYFMFKQATNFNSAINFTNTSLVSNMGYMFDLATSFNQPLTFNTASVTNMSYMFQLASAFNSTLTFNTANVTNMRSMFDNATNFNQDISSFNVANVLNFTNFMLGKTAANYSTTNLDAIYNGWSGQAVKPNLNIHFGTIKYTAAGSAGKAILTGAPNNWVCVDGGI